MIEFVTAILGLTWGDIPVEMRTDPQVARIEVRIDGTQIAEFDRPPWAFRLRLGDQLLPHHLEVLAFGKTGESLGAASQLINHARPSYEASLWLTPENRHKGEVHWAAVLDIEPSDIEVDFDGLALEVDQRGRFALPAHDLSVPHVLEARLVFVQKPLSRRTLWSRRSIRWEARADLSFGGFHGDRVTSALTAVPISVPRGLVVPAEDVVASWFESSGTELRVFEAGSVEGALLVVVRDLSLITEWQTASHSIPMQMLPAILHEDDQVAYISTRAARDGAGVFPIVGAKKKVTKHGLVSALDIRPRFDGTAPPRRIWDTLAVAGKTALGGNKVRAIVLLLGDDDGESSEQSSLEVDSSVLNFGQVQSYLAAIQVPLFCWEPDAGRRCSGTRAFRGVGGVVELLASLDQAMSSQRIVWLEGNHLPQAISLTSSAPAGVELVR